MAYKTHSIQQHGQLELCAHLKASPDHTRVFAAAVLIMFTSCMKCCFSVVLANEPITYIFYECEGCTMQCDCSPNYLHVVGSWEAHQSLLISKQNPIMPEHQFGCVSPIGPIGGVTRGRVCDFMACFFVPRVFSVTGRPAPLAVKSSTPLYHQMVKQQQGPCAMHVFCSVIRKRTWWARTGGKVLRWWMRFCSLQCSVDSLHVHVQLWFWSEVWLKKNCVFGPKQMSQRSSVYTLQYLQQSTFSTALVLI